MNTIRLFLTAVLFTFVLPVKAQIPASSGYAPVNGLKMYYEVYGEGKPLVLLHGAFMTIGLNYGELIPELAKHHKVIAVEVCLETWQGYQNHSWLFYRRLHT